MIDMPTPSNLKHFNLSFFLFYGSSLSSSIIKFCFFMEPISAFQACHCIIWIDRKHSISISFRFIIIIYFYFIYLFFLILDKEEASCSVYFPMAREFLLYIFLSNCAHYICGGNGKKIPLPTSDIDKTSVKAHWVVKYTT